MDRITSHGNWDRGRAHHIQCSFSQRYSICVRAIRPLAFVAFISGRIFDMQCVAATLVLPLMAKLTDETLYLNEFAFDDIFHKKLFDL